MFVLLFGSNLQCDRNTIHKNLVLSLFVAEMIFMMGIMFSQFYRKVGPEEAVVRSGQGGLRAATGSGIFVIPILHRAEQMDLSVKRIEIARRAARAASLAAGRASCSSVARPPPGSRCGDTPS